MSEDNAALVWNTFQAAAVRWPKVRDEPGLHPPTRHALDIAAAVQELVVRGDASALEMLAATARKLVANAQRPRKLGPELRRLRRSIGPLLERKLKRRPRDEEILQFSVDRELRRRASLRAGVEHLLASDGSAADIVHLIEVRSPELNMLAEPKDRPVRGRVGRLTTPEERAKAVDVVQTYLLQTQPQARDAATIIERVLVHLDVKRDAARKIAMRPRKPGQKTRE